MIAVALTSVNVAVATPGDEAAVPWTRSRSHPRIPRSTKGYGAGSSAPPELSDLGRRPIVVYRRLVLYEPVELLPHLPQLQRVGAGQGVNGFEFAEDVGVTSGLAGGDDVEDCGSADDRDG